MTKYLWTITLVNGTVEEIETVEPSPAVNTVAFTVTDHLGRRQSYCWVNVANVTSEQLQEGAGGPAPS